MRILYEANDGKLFDTEMECEVYEFEQTLIALDKITLTSFDGEQDFAPTISQEAYDNCQFVRCEDEDAVDTLHRIANWGGWPQWNEITDPGEWEFIDLSDTEGKFIRIGD